MTALSWPLVLQSVRAVADAEPYRLGVLDGIRGWMQIASAWQSAAAHIALVPPSAKLDDAMQLTIDERLSWCWAECRGLTDAAFQVMDSRTTLSTFDTTVSFEIMLANALIYPDGTVNKLVTNVLSSEGQIATTRRAGLIAKATVAVARSQIMARKAASEVQAENKRREAELRARK